MLVNISAGNVLSFLWLPMPVFQLVSNIWQKKTGTRQSFAHIFQVLIRPQIVFYLISILWNQSQTFAESSVKNRFFFAPKSALCRSLWLTACSCHHLILSFGSDVSFRSCCSFFRKDTKIMCQWTPRASALSRKVLKSARKGLLTVYPFT